MRRRPHGGGCFRPAQDMLGKRRRSQPARHGFAQDSALALATAGDDEHAAMPLSLSPREEAFKRRVCAFLRHPMEIEPGGDRIAPALKRPQRAPIEWGRARRRGRAPRRRARTLARRRCRLDERRGRLGGRWSWALPRVLAFDQPHHIAHRPVPERELERRDFADARVHGAFYPMRSIKKRISRLGPCAPSSIEGGMSPVREGPVTRLTERGGQPGNARSMAQASS